MDDLHGNIVSFTDLEIERCNIIHLTKLIVKDILRVAVQCNRQLDEDNSLIIQLLRVLEGIVNHGLKPRKILNSVSIIGFSNPDPWPVICDVLRKNSALEIIETVNQMNIKSGIGKFRAWLKLALMQKQLGEYFHSITEQTRKLETYYYPAAILLQESGVEISGLLVGLSVVDCNFLNFKNQSSFSDSYVGPLNYSTYMKQDFDEVNTLPTKTDNSEEIVKGLLDQKNYTEELNSIFQTKLQKLQNSYNSLEKDAANCKLLLAESTNRNFSLQEELNHVRSNNKFLQDQFDHKNRLIQDDIQIERSTYQTSCHELNQLNIDLDKKLKEEVQIRLDADRSLKMEVQRRSDIELGMGTLERQIQEKQQTILSLRKQMEQIKVINIDLNKELKEKQNIVDHKTMLVEKLEEKTSGMANIIDQMDQRIKKSLADKHLTESQILELRKKFEAVQESCSSKDKEIESLNDEILELNEDISKLTLEKEALVEKSTKLISQLEYVEKELAISRKRIHDQTETLSDMAKILENSKLEMDGLREMQASFQEARWTADKEVNQCIQCAKPFNVSRRKHHCRRCGGVFCHECSSNRMCLASAAKPMRVCDTCHNALLKNYTSMTSRNDSEE